MKRLILMCVCCVMLAGCVENVPDADKRQAAETQKRLLEADKQIGMPDIVNFTERRLAKDILELRDQETLLTYTYLVSLEGKLVFLGRLPPPDWYTVCSIPIRRWKSTGIKVVMVRFRKPTRMVSSCPMVCPPPGFC